MNPPAPVPCPVGGRYNFTQLGLPEEKYVTRVRGITERPRHMIDCYQYVSELKSCDDNPKKIYVDAEYCATLDHTGKPIGEYGRAPVDIYSWIYCIVFCRSRFISIILWLLNDDT